MFLAVGDGGNGVGAVVQCRWTDDIISQLPDQCQTESRSSASADVSVSHRLQHESSQEVISRGCSRVNIDSDKTQKETIKYDRFLLYACIVSSKRLCSRRKVSFDARDVSEGRFREGASDGWKAALAYALHRRSMCVYLFRSEQSRLCKHITPSEIQMTHSECIFGVHNHMQPALILQTYVVCDR